MSMRETDLVGDVQILKGIHMWNPNFVSEMTTLVSALGGDTTTHSAEIETAPLALRIDASHSRLTNDAILLVNNAKAGNLSKFQIIAAFDDALAIAHAPANVAVPYAQYTPAGPPAVGTVCTCTVGQWTSSPTRLHLPMEARRRDQFGHGRELYADRRRCWRARDYMCRHRDERDRLDGCATVQCDSYLTGS